jgi:putative ABC transport system ATP-binding protein
MSTSYLFKTSKLQKTYTKEEDTSPSATIDALIQSKLCYCGLHIPRGRFIAIIGESGTGKTTLLNMLGGLDAPDTIDGKTSIEIDLGNGPVDIVKNPDAYPHSSVGYIFQEGYLLLNATVGMNIALPMIQKGHDVTQQNLEPIFQNLKLPIDFLERRAWQLSGGQAQRIAFARAVSHNPKLIIADEPTNDLDYRLANKMIHWLKEWCQQESDRTVLWVTHDLEQAATHADGIIILRNGSEGFGYPLKNPNVEKRELIKQWVYGEDIASEYQIPLDSSEIIDKAATPENDKPVSSSYVKFKAMSKVALAEIFSHQSALKDKRLSAPLNAKLSLAGKKDQNRAKVNLWSLFRTFGQWSSVIVLILITLLALMGILSWSIMTQHFDRSVNDPRNCHILVTGKANLSRDPLSKREIKELSQRPWEVKKDHSKPIDDMESNAIYPSASCNDGPATFGRRDARAFDIALAQEGKCLPSDETVRLLITEPYEPILQKIFLLDADEQAQDSLYHFFREVHTFPQTDEIYLTSDIENALLKEKNKTLLGQQVCLADFNRGWDEVYTVKGIVDDLPSGGRQIFHAYITEETYQALRRETGNNLLESFTDVAIYFSGSDVDSVKKHLDEHELVYVEDNFTKIRNMITSSIMFKAIILMVIIVIGVLLIFFISMSVNNYLEKNAKSFAVLKSFGISKRFITGILVLQFSIGWLVSTMFLAIIAFLASVFFRPWLVSITGLDFLTHQVIFNKFGIASVGVIIIGWFVSWIIVKHWWKQNQYVSELLKST